MLGANVSQAVMIAVMHGPYEPWERIAREGQSVTWIPRARSLGVATIYVHGEVASMPLQHVDRWHEAWRWTSMGGRSATRALIMMDRTVAWPFRSRLPAYSLGHAGHLPSDCLLVRMPDMYLTQRWKDLALFHYFIHSTNLKYLYMTTTSSYVDVERFLKQLVDMEPRGLYAGPIMGAGRHQFVSGASRLLSRDVVALALEMRHRWDAGRLEDHALGLLLEGAGVSMTEVPSRNLSSLAEVISLENPGVDLPFHFRLKSGPLGQRADVPLMLALHERLTTT